MSYLSCLIRKNNFAKKENHFLNPEVMRAHVHIWVVSCDATFCSNVWAPLMFSLYLQPNYTDHFGKQFIKKNPKFEMSCPSVYMCFHVI